MKNLRIFSTKTDDYLKTFSQEAKKINLKVSIYKYENFSFADNKLTYLGRKEFPQFTENDVVFFRRSAYEKKKQHFWLRLLATLARDAGARVLNEDFMVNFPLHSGKLFQAAYFSAMNIPHISTYRIGKKLPEENYPWLIKKRYTAFGVDSHLVLNKEEFAQIKRKLRGLDNFVMQPFLELDRDIRVMVLGGKIHGSVNRIVRIGEDGHVGVKVSGVVDLTDEEKRIAEQVLSVFKLDFAGLDIFTSKNGKIWLGEINFFPNFSSFMEASDKNVFKDVLDMMLDEE